MIEIKPGIEGIEAYSKEQIQSCIKRTDALIKSIREKEKDYIPKSPGDRI